MTEEQLIRGCINEDAFCQREVFNRYAGRMLGVCNRYARNSADAEDILQDAFMKVFDKLGQFKFEGSFEGWIRRIMVFTAINMFKHRTRKFQEDLDKEGYEGVYEDQIIEKITAREIVALIQQMPDGYKMIFNLYAVEGYTHREIGEMLGIAEGTSKSQYSRARSYMQQVITKHYHILNEPFQEPT